jgi:plasmid stabilization system protein ParE
MRRRVVWTSPALDAFSRRRLYLERQRTGLGVDYEGDVAKALLMLSVEPQRARPAGAHTQARLWSLPHWNAVLVVRESHGNLEVVAVRDTRMKPEVY